MSDEKLHVQMFGDFALRYRGKIITNEGRTSESQFAYLMQLVLHNRKNGISRDQVERILFEDRDLDDVHHATRSVVYNAKKKLRSSGLPDVNYLEVSKGVLRWTEEIPVVEDAEDAFYRASDLILRAFQKMRGRFVAVGLVKVSFPVQEIRTFSLGGQ